MASLTTVETSYGSGSRPLGPLTWAALRAMDTSGLHAGDFVEVSDLGYSHWVWNGTLWRPRAPVLLNGSAVPVNLTGSTAETVLATITVPPGAMGLNGGLTIYSSWSMPSTANNKQMRVRFGGLAGVSYGGQTLTTSLSNADVRLIRNRGSASSQVGHSSGTGPITSASTAALVVSALDTSGPVDVAITGQLTSAAETLTLESRAVWLNP